MTGTINLIFYVSDSKSDASRRLLRIIETVIPSKLIKIHRTIKGVAGSFRRPSDHPVIALIYISNGKELQDVMSISDLLFGVPLILILPDSNKEAVAMAHSLRPRFLTYKDSDVREVSGVLGRMIEKLGREYSFR